MYTLGEKYKTTRKNEEIFLFFICILAFMLNFKFCFDINLRPLS